MKRIKSSKKKRPSKNWGSSLFLAIAAILISLLLNRLYLRYRPIPITTIKTEQDRVGDIELSKPESIEKSNIIYPNLSIPKLNLTLPIYHARVINGKWQTTARGLSHAVTSAPLGHTGNTVIYGHNWPNMLKKLPTLLPGDVININLGENKTYTYTVTYTATISPDDSSLTAPTHDNRLTLYTCAGMLDSQRYVVVAHMNWCGIMLLYT